MRFGVVRFPGSCDEVDALMACERAGEAELLWHKDPSLDNVDAVVIPGGFSYGDYLRAGAIAAVSPIMASVKRFAADGGPVLGICNGFQVLCEAGLLPGALLPSVTRRFACRQVVLEVVDADTAFTRQCTAGETVSMPAKHQWGRWYAPPELLAETRVVFRYAADEVANGSTDLVAGVANAAGNVVGLMPHPEHAVDPLLGPTDGLTLFRSAVTAPVG